MADCTSVVAVDVDGLGIAPGKQSVKTMEATEKLTDEMMRIISDLDDRFSTVKLAETGGVTDIEERLDFVEKKVLNWGSDDFMIRDCDPEEATEYLRVADEVRRLTENLETLKLKKENQLLNELLRRAHSILQMAMVRLEEEFTHLLVQHQQPLEPDHMSFRSMEDDLVDDYSNSSFGEELVEVRFRSDSSRGSEEFLIDLIHPDAITDLKCIADVMFLSNYDKECCQAYINIRRGALDECLSVLHAEKLSIEEVLRMDWNVLNGKIKRWNRAMKLFIRVYLTSERCLCDHIFGDFPGSVGGTNFTETSKSSILQLLNFGEAVAIGHPMPEKLFRILDMYEGLADLIPDIEALFQEESGSCILTECHEVLRRLGEAIRVTFIEFKNAIRNNTSTTAFAGGGYHHLTRYVMNYIKVLADYSETLNCLLKDQYVKDEFSVCEEDGEMTSCNLSPLGRSLQSVTLVLETNLDEKSLLYRDTSLQHFFMMNNIYYMMKKVKDSELRSLLGDDWVRSHRSKFRQHALNYERASWNPILSLLKDEGISNLGSNSSSKTVLKERFKSFNLAIEEVYKTQTAWLIPDVQLREELRISISLKVIQAYRTFIGRYASHLDSVRHRERYIKFCQDDLQNYLLDLFEGSPKSLHIPRRR